MRLRCLVLTLLTICTALCVSAQEYTGQTPPQMRMQWYQAHTEMKENSRFKNLSWQFLGPTNISGRMTDAAVVEPKGSNYTIFVAGATGGVWRTQNEGITWEPVFEHGVSTSIGDVTIAPSDPQIVWIGTGEANIFRSSHAGAGVYKSTDGGDTWVHMGLTGTNTIPRILIHPTNPDIVYVASTGNEWTDNEERGLYKTTDGGTTWEKVLYIDDRTGVIDMVMHPDRPNTLYAATWQRIRRKWNDPRVEEGYSKSTIYKSTNGGKSWDEVTNGLIAPEYRGRIGIDICRNQPNTLYAFIDNYESARMPEEGELDSYGRPRGPVIRGATVFRTDDGADNWRRVSQYNDYMERLSSTYGWVFGQIRVDPNIPDRVYIMGISLHVSDDSGRNFRAIGQRQIHGDHHGLWIDPANSNYLVNTNDGGVAISYDAGKNWRDFLHDFPLVQFFNVSYDMDEPFGVYGSIQDHGSFMAHVDLSQGRHNIPAVEWNRAPGGEGTRHAIDPTDPSIVYSSSFYGRLNRTDRTSNQDTSILPQPDEGELPFRGQWLAPTIISPHNPRVIYHGMNYLFRSMNRGDAWERISPDLTYNNPDYYGDIPYQTLFAVAESHFQFGVLFVGTDDGRIHRTMDHGQTWEELTDKLPVHQWVSKIVASEHADGTVYLTQNGKRFDDFAAYVWKSTNQGDSWTSIADGIPGGPVNSIAEDPRNPDILYVGTDLGVYVSVDGGDSWDVLGKNIPTTFVHDLTVHPREDILLAASEGRGMYAIDVRFIQQMATASSDGLHLFDLAAAQIPRRRWQKGTNAYIAFAANEGGEYDLNVANSDGHVIFEHSSTCDPGFNVLDWNLRTAGDDGLGAYVEPGDYKVTITSAGHEASAELLVTN